MVEYCNLKPVHASYLMYMFTNLALIISHALLLLHTVYVECRTRSRSHAKFKKTRTVRALYMAMQIMSLLFQIDELLLYNIDSDYGILSTSSFLCGFCACFVYYVPGCFYGLYLLSIAIRLETSLEGSTLALSKRNALFLKSVTLLIPIISSTTLALDAADTVCLRVWTADDVGRVITYCNMPSVSLLVFQYHIYEGIVALINVLNILFGVILTFKLIQFVKMGTNGSNQFKKYRHQSLIIRNIILTLSGSVSTTISYALYALKEDGTFVSIDMLINCMVIGLMFKWNDWCYNKVCCGCIWICFKICDPSNASETVARTADYINDSEKAKKGRPQLRSSVATKSPPSRSTVSSSKNCEGDQDVL